MGIKFYKYIDTVTAGPKIKFKLNFVTWTNQTITDISIPMTKVASTSWGYCKTRKPVYDMSAADID